ncbi:hypothetical protein MAHJHV57_53080 [Mycobacterium avium subsp. hominissuis]|uniref:Uncharacterized protein n=2 Tax=Mycobacterium avium complex (MAC) TaxID=120793 RepID=A0ABX3TE15_9MYCO|nr:hypothetical protein BST19_21335 [Mycobacterium bouchedurhonense]ORB77048.1 hypothetical protein BST46_26735 [Mycobacterium timonense]
MDGPSVNWERWISDVEDLLGHSAVGDLSHDGHSIHSFQKMWRAGWTAQAAVEAVWAGKPLR